MSLARGDSAAGSAPLWISADTLRRALPMSAAIDVLEETLRAWVRHQGRREDMAAELFVHPQTVRYRMGQLRELYADRLTDPDWVVRVTLALG